MKKKLGELCGNDLNKLCYPPTGNYPNCNDCPLRIKNINSDCPPNENFYCIKGLVNDKSKLTMELVRINELLDKYDNLEIEVEEE